jgi:hypothetical protein
MRTCPKCGLANPDSAIMCDCGHAFDAFAADKARAEGFSPWNEIKPPGPSAGAKFGVGVLGYFIGGLPMACVSEILDSTGRAGGHAFQGASFFTGITGVIVALNWQKKRYQSRSKK